MTEPNRPESHDSWLNQPAEPDLWAQPAIKKESTPSSAAPPDGWEREVLEKLVLATVAEQRAARRWRIFWRLLWLALLGAVVWAVSVRDLTGVTKSSPHTAVIDIKGEIAVDAQTSADAVVASLRSAFEDSGAQAVVLLVNSPGGSPVQAGMIADEIRRLRAKYPDTPLYAVVEEVCASGGYYVAAAADRIYVDKASLVGSIGVLMDGFGFVGTMDKLGVERRLITSGRNKGFLDSFSPLPEEQRQYAQSMLDEIHQQFIDVVRRGRGERLKDVPDLFSGLVWTGARSIEIGLSDGLGTVDSVARDVIKAEEVVDFSARKNLAERLARRFGASLGETMATALRASSSFHLR